MVILKSIGAFFTKLWRWIKETAWVQPLLIVGAIFAVIFSIPKITDWVQSMGFGSASRYYAAFQLNLEGETSDIFQFNTKADEATKAINDWSNFEDTYATYDEYIAAMEQSEENPIEKYGEKFFLVYVEGENCTNCEAAQPGFETLQNYWGTRYVADDGRPFKMYTIFADEDSSNDDEYDIEDDQKAFNRYLDKFADNDFFSQAGGRLADETPYKINASIGDADYENFTNADHTSFAVPTVLLIDFSEQAFDLRSSRPGVSEVIFGVTGNDSNAKAELLLQMWNHTSNDITNPFTDYYVKG